MVKIKLPIGQPDLGQPDLVTPARSCFYETRFLLGSNKGVIGWVIASESTAFTPISAKFLREVEPGEVVEITTYGIFNTRKVARPANSKPAFCIFEYVYFARSDSFFEGLVFVTVDL